MRLCLPHIGIFSFSSRSFRCAKCFVQEVRKKSILSMLPQYVCVRFDNKELTIFSRKEMFYLTTQSTHFIYGYMASDIWLRTILIVRKETHCHHIGYSFQLAARVLLYAPSHRQDSTYHSQLWRTGWNEKSNNGSTP